MATASPYPTGIVTFVFTDIQDSTRITRLLDLSGKGLYERHLRDPCRQRLDQEVHQHRGREVQRAGDGHMFVFPSADDALAAVVAFQQSLAADLISYQHEPDGERFTVRVSIGLHTTGTARGPEPLPNGLVEYPGTDTNFAARIGALGEGGQILLSEEARARAATMSTYTLHEWPNRRLKGFEEQPQTVYEILYLPDQVPCEPGTRFFPAFYTGEPNRYIPRPEKEEQVFAQYRNRLQDGTTSRLVTIHAEGGMGKTRLAVTCAVQMAGLFEGGIFLVRFGETSAASPAGVAEAIGRELGLPPEASRPEALLQALKGRRTRTLLLLDNYEAVSCEEVTGFLARLATETFSVYLLVASRTPVNVPELEQVVSLEAGMTEGEARDLFLARARLKGRLTDDLSTEEAAHLERILRLTERIPLAVELAAAWVRHETLAEIADGLEDTPLGEETSVPPGAVRVDEAVTAGRHRSLTRSLDWSYALLGKNDGPAAQRVFTVCGLFADTFDAVTLTTLSGEARARSILIRLQDASLVRATPVHGVMRHRLHRFTREFAARHLGDFNEAEQIRRRFIEHYVTIVREHGGSPSNPDSRDLLDREWRNTLAAAGLAEAMQDHRAVIYLSDLPQYLTLRSLWSEWEPLAERAVAAARGSGEQHALGITLNNLGLIYQHQGRWEEATHAYQEALTVFGELGARADAARTFNELGVVFQRQGRWQEAISAFQEALAICHALEDRRTAGQFLGNLATLYRLLGHWQEAFNAHQEALASCREYNDRHGMAANLIGLGNIYFGMGRWEEAIAVHREALEIYRELGSRLGVGMALHNLGNAYHGQGRWEEAVTAYQESLAVRRELGDRIGEGQSLTCLGNEYQRQSRWEDAIRAYEEALAICRETGDCLGEAMALNNLGVVYGEQDRWEEAINAYQAALSIRRELGDRHGAGRALCNLALLWESRGEPGKALPLAREAVAVLGQTDATADLRWARSILARLEGATASGARSGGRGFWGGLSDLLKRPEQHRDD